jgi:outer membrane protein TolC
MSGVSGWAGRVLGVALVTGASTASLTLAAAPVDADALSLSEALVQALERSPQLRVARLEPTLARERVERERAGWDPVLGLVVDRSDSKLPASSGLDGAPVRDSDTTAAAVTLTRPLGDGSSVELGISDRRNASNSTFAIVNPTFRSGVSVTYRRPLLRGSGRDSNRRGLGLAELELERTRWILRREVLAVLAATERAYWNLGAARERVGVAELSLDQARTLLEGNRFRAETGALSPVSVLEAEAAVTERRDSSFLAQRARARAEVELLQRVAPPVRADLDNPVLRDSPGAALPEVPEHIELMRLAYENDPGLRLAHLDADARGVELAFAKDATLMRLDLTASLEANGLSGSRSTNSDQLAGLDYPSSFVGLVFEVPLGKRAARAEQRRAAVAVERSLAAVRVAEVDLTSRVEDARRRYRFDRQRIEVAQDRVVAAERKLVAEEQRFIEGLLPADDLLRFQRELAEARVSEVGARAGAALATVDMWAAAGVLPERRGVALDELGLDERGDP